MLLHFFVTTRITQTCLIFALLIVVHAQDSTQPLIRSTTAPTSWMIPHHEHEALVELYESCSGASWGPLYTSTWLRSGSICGVWAGVECSFYEEPSPSLTTETNKGLAHVTGLTIANIPLRCELPTSLAALVHIRSIDFTNSPLYGQRFPEVIRAWFYIETIRLRGTHIVGALPNWLSRRSRLRFLDVSENSELFGAIPASYAALEHLSVFLAHNTMLQGRIPPFLEHVTEWNLRSENASEFDAPCPPPAWVWKGINENQLACSRTPGIMPVLGPVQHPPQMIINTTVPEELTYPPAVAPDTTPSSQQNKEEREVEKILDSINGEEVWMWEDPSGANGSASSNTTRALNATYPSTDTWDSSTTLGTPSEDVISGTGLILLIISVIGTLIGMSYLMRRVASRAGYLDLNDTDAITQMSHSSV